MCYEGPLDRVSQDCWSTRWSALWYVYLHIVFAFTLFVCCIIGWHSISSQNWSVTWWLLLFTTNLILPSGLRSLEKKARIGAFGGTLNRSSDPLLFTSSFLKMPLFLFAWLFPCFVSKNIYVNSNVFYSCTNKICIWGH